MMADHVMADSASGYPNQENQIDQDLEKHRESVLRAIDKVVDKSSEYEEHFRELLQATSDDPQDEPMLDGQSAEPTPDGQPATSTPVERDESMAIDHPAESTSDHRARRTCHSSHLNEHSNQLQLNLLPSLRHHLTSLARLLDPSALRQDPHHQIRSILETLSKLEESLDAIQLSFRLSFRTFRKNGGAYPELMLVKYLYVITKLSRVKGRISCHLLRSYYNFMEKINFSPTRLNNETIQANLVIERFFCSRVHANTAESLQLIDQLHEWIGLSEFGVLYGSWREVMTWICMPYLAMEAPKSKQLPAVKKPPSKKFHQMVTLSVPILKLARLFFKKLADTATIRGDFGIDFELNMSQIQQLMSDSLMVFSDLNRISNVFKLIRGDHQAHPLQDELGADLQGLSPEMQNLSQHFKSLFSHLHSYVLIYPLRNHFKTWCHTWDNEITWAIENFVQIAEEQAVLALVRHQLQAE